jgi:hypothetical protein
MGIGTFGISNQGSKLMITDLDIWRCVALVIKRYGDTADIEAAARADGYEAKGERDEQRVWLRIARAIDELRTVRADKI